MPSETEQAIERVRECEKLGLIPFSRDSFLLLAEHDRLKGENKRLIGNEVDNVIEDKTYYGKDCPVGMVQVEFVGCSPGARYSEYGWKPVGHAFLEVYVDGHRFRIDVGDFHDGVAQRRGLHVISPTFLGVEKTSMNAASLFVSPLPTPREKEADHEPQAK